VNGLPTRLGVILPSNNTVLEPEAYAVLPAGITAHFTRIQSGGQSARQLMAMERNSGRAIRELLVARVDALLYACLSTSLAKGAGWDERFVEDTRATTPIPCVTAALATVEGLKALGARRIAVAHPYPDEIGRLLPAYFRAHGLEIASVRALDTSDGTNVCDRRPEETYALGRAAWSAGSDALCIVATDLRSLDVIAALERDLGAPVVTTNQALIWAALRRVGLPAAIAGRGLLLAGSPLVA
jgi:maleate isomerase